MLLTDDAACVVAVEATVDDIAEESVVEVVAAF